MNNTFRESDKSAIQNTGSNQTKQNTGSTFWSPTLICMLSMSFVYSLLVVVALLYIPPDSIVNEQSVSTSVRDSSVSLVKPSDIPRTGSVATRTDFLSFVMPILAIAFGWLVSLLGLKRLSQFDEDIERVRTSAELQRKNFQDSVNMRISEVRADIKDIADAYIRNHTQSRLDQLEEKLEIIESEAAKRIAEIESSLSPYKWLEDKKDETDLMENIPSVGFAHAKVTSLLSEDRIDMAMRIAERVVQEKVRGDSDDFHNLCAELAQKDLFAISSRIISLGLEFYPSNCDLLASAVKYKSSNGEMDEAESCFLLLNSLPKDRWNWRAFVFISDYLVDSGRFDEAISVLEDFKVYIPYDERAYSEHGEIFQKLGKLDEARNIYEKCLGKIRRVSQTGNLLGQLLIEIGEYDKAIEALDRSIESTSDSQPSTSIASLFFNRANARDSIVHRGETHELELLDDINLAIRDYKMAMTITDGPPLYRYRGSQRIRILRLYARNRGIDIDLVENENGNDLQSIQQLHERFRNGENNVDSDEE